MGVNSTTLQQGPEALLEVTADTQTPKDGENNPPGAARALH